MAPIDRRTALTVVAGLFARQQPRTTCNDVLVLDLASQVGCTVQAIKVQLGAVSATIPTSELLKALGARLGGNE